MIRCKVYDCPYFDKSFCAKPLLSIDENAMCETHWYRGRRQSIYNGKDDPNLSPKKQLLIFDTDFETIEEEEKEEAGNR